MLAALESANKSAGPARGRAGGFQGLQPIPVLDHLPERVLVDDLVALEFVDVAALVIEDFAVGAAAAHGPNRDGAVGRGEDVFLVFPAHIRDPLEAGGERLADRRLAGQRAADRLWAAGQAEDAVLGKKRDDAVDVAAVERRRDRPHQLKAYHSPSPHGAEQAPY